MLACLDSSYVGDVRELMLVEIPRLREALGDDLATAADGFACRGCGRPEHACSVQPCADVLADREASPPQHDATLAQHAACVAYMARFDLLDSAATRAELVAALCIPAKIVETFSRYGRLGVQAA